jgi:electron transfer flavoprotein alpha subunit
MPILVLAEHNNLSLNGSTFPTITAAMQCGDDVHLLVAGHNCAAVAASAAQVAGVSKVLLADAAHFAHGLAEHITEQVLALASAYSHILAPATSYGKNILPRVAARLGVSQISEVSKVLSSDTFERPTYAGNVVATVQSSDPVKVITVRTTSFAGMTEGDLVAIEKIAATAPCEGVRFVSRDSATSTRPELASASVVVSGGRGMGSSENFKILEPLADKFGAAMGASRAAVDAGFVPNDWQIGQTGKIVAPKLYIAVGISGAIQHLAGMKDSQTIVAINKDPEAPIFAVADYGIVGDLFDVVPRLVAALE